MHRPWSVRGFVCIVYKPAWIYETVPRLSTCDILLHCSASLPHCSIPYSSAFAQHCIVAPYHSLSCCTHLHPYCQYPPRVSPSDPMSLLQVRPLPTISSELQHFLSLAIWAAWQWSTTDIKALATGPEYWNPLDSDRLMHRLFINGRF